MIRTVDKHILGLNGLASQKKPFPSRPLKDTPANRALFPESTEQSVYERASSLASTYYADALTVIIKSDAIAALQSLIELGITVDCIVTSPPFYGQRDYRVRRQIGLEEHPSKYIEKLMSVFSLCKKVLSDTGSLWVNLGDTYWSGKGQHRSSEEKQEARRFGLRPQDKTGDGKWCRPKQLLLIPHRFAIAMQDDEWLVRNDNVWVKPNPIPDQVRDRCAMSHEYMFHFTKQRWYYFNRDAVSRQTSSGKRLPPFDTWVVPPARGNGKHRATFSEDLIRVPILSTCYSGAIVLDPFAGSGTALSFARQHGIRSIGIDIKEEYCKMARKSVRQLEPLLPLHVNGEGGDN